MYYICIYVLYMYIYVCVCVLDQKIVLKTHLFITNISVSLQKLCLYNETLWKTKQKSTQQLIQTN